MIASLSATLAPPRTATKGRAGALEQRRGASSTSRCEVGPGGAGQKRRGHHDRRVRAVRRAEGVVDVGVEALDERRAEGGSLASSPGSKRRFSRSSTSGQSSLEAPAHRRDAVALVDLAVRAPEVRAATTTAPRARAGPRRVGSAARMRKSSATSRSPSTSASGTLKSTRTSTRLPSRSPQLVDRTAAASLTSDCRRCGRGRRGGSSSPTRCRTSRRP